MFLKNNKILKNLDKQISKLILKQNRMPNNFLYDSRTLMLAYILK